MLIRLSSLFLGLILFSSLAFASECLLSKALKDPELSQNAAFWDDYAKLAGKGEPKPAELQSLIDKYQGGKSAGNTSTATAANTNFQASATYRVQSKAEKEIKALPKNLHGKVDEFVEMATKPGGMQDLRSNPSRWHLEKLAQFGDHAYSVRLNDGYRVLFDYDKETHHLEIRRVNKGQIHGS